MSDETPARKRDHINICLDLGPGVEYSEKTTWLEYVELVHSAAPEIDLEEISTEARLLGRRFKLPLLIEGMTGGTSEAHEINRNLAEAAEKLEIPMEVGSQRAGLADPGLEYTYRIARESAPKAFLIGNISAVQLAKEGVAAAEKAVEMIEADALALHLNALQELVQPEGSPFFRNVVKAIREASEKLQVPLIAKEVGTGISGETAKMLAEAGVKVIDVAGAGGTNWARIELERAKGIDPEKVSVAEVFLEWGIPTAASVLEVASSVQGVEIVASGGIRNGLQAAKAIAIGADFVGMARPFLKPATIGPEAVVSFAERFGHQLKAAMFLTGVKTIEELKKRRRYVLLGPLLEWMRQRLRAL